MSYKITITSDFEKSAKKLAKKYASFKNDLSSFLKGLNENPLQGNELYPGIRKIRMQIKSKGKGKSGGARVITFNALIDEKEGNIILLLLYDKEEASTVDVAVVKELIKGMNL